MSSFKTIVSRLSTLQSWTRKSTGSSLGIQCVCWRTIVCIGHRSEWVKGSVYLGEIGGIGADTFAVAYRRMRSKLVVLLLHGLYKRLLVVADVEVLRSGSVRLDRRL